jgi:hypothetical protein
MNIEESLIKQVALEAKRHHITQTELIKMILVSGLNELRASRKARTLDIPVVSGSGLRPGVNLDDRSELLDLINDGTV